MNKKKLLILNATSLYQDGGLTILKKFLKYNFDKVYFDPRLKNLFTNPFLYKLYLDFYFFFNTGEKTKIIYLSGTPPVIKSKAYIICCFQNSNIFCNQSNFFKWLFSKDSVRYIFFSLFKKNVDSWLVFSPLAKFILAENGIQKKNIKLIKIFDFIKSKKKINQKKYDFIYPASILKHKNHLNLILALILLAKKKIYPKVLLTINKKEILNSVFIKLIFKFKLKVTCKYFYNSIDEAYNNSVALIYPSLNETIGIPIIEAYNHDLYILTSNRIYAKQFIKPSLVFDPLDPQDISNKIENFLIKKKLFKKGILIKNYKFIFSKGRNIFFNL
jgi:hypothetical protein